MSDAKDEVRPVPPRLGFDVNAAIAKELGKTEPTSTVAFVCTAQKTPGANVKGKMAVMVKQPDGGWSFGGYLEGEYHVGLTVGAELRYER